MKQYCRYCAEAVIGDLIWCEAKHHSLTEKACKKANTCRLFVFNEIDLFDGDKVYKPTDVGERQKKTEDGKNQIKLF